jgi:hypothetical protein
MMFLPPNTTHVLQPLDNLVYGHLKRIAGIIRAQRSYAHFVATGKDEEGGAALASYEALLRTLSNKNIVRKSFERTGIYPFNAERINAFFECPDEIPQMFAGGLTESEFFLRLGKEVAREFREVFQSGLRKHVTSLSGQLQETNAARSRKPSFAWEIEHDRKAEEKRGMV